ncbi:MULTISPECIES: hypothetical protein [unclassified Rhizobium]|uniref:hypothetical protein n=1 Tax=unclassified Rhizobium TaxID=2613769 RepID=UPI0006F6337B|nr:MULTISPECIES: hypothetical protein [unclassified Rhizobium]KQV43378.1 hypothetical protein ASC86_00730 [Rhizobium sp. Root1212]KRD37563.1 hypothetical protein ASE37_00730 [Rhizobium sp. Root268]
MLLGLLALSACQRETSDEPLQLSGKIFVFNYRLAYATYMVTLNKKEPVPEGSVVVATFENPAGGEPLLLERKVFTKQEKIVLESPDVTCVRKQKPYAVTIELKGPDGDLLQTVKTTVTSTLDQDVLPAKPLVIGPAYDKNPEVFKDGKAPAHFETAKCNA